MELPKKSLDDYDRAISHLNITGSDFDIITKSEWIDGTEVHARSPIWVDINTEINRLSTYGGEEATWIYIFGDCIDSAESPPKISLRRQKEINIILTARLWFPSANQPVALHLDLPIGSIIEFRTNELPKDFSVVFNGKKTPLKPNPGSWGINVELTKEERSGTNVIVVEDTILPGDELATFEHLDGLLGGHASETKNRLRENLPRLLKYQFILASSWFQTDVRSAYSLLTFIAEATKRAPAAFDLNLQANILAGRLGADGLLNYVPSLDLGACKRVLKARLAAVQAFESSYDKFVSLLRANENAQTSGELALGHSMDVESQYLSMEGLAKKRYDDAWESYRSARRGFQALEKELNDKSKTFTEAIKKKENDELKMLPTKKFGTILKVGAGLATAAMGAKGVVSGMSGGAAAAKVASGKSESQEGGLGDSLKKSADGISSIMTGIEEYKQLEDHAVKIIRAVAAVDDVVDSTIALVGAATSRGKEDSTAHTDVPSYRPDNTIGLKSEWDEYEKEMEAALGSVKPLLTATAEIKQYDEYYGALQKLPIRGRAIVTAQKEYIEAGDTYTHVLLKRGTANKNNERLKKALTKLGADKNTIGTVHRVMIERLVSIRAWVTVDLHGYLAAYKYFSLNSTPPIQISATQPASYYMEGAARLQSAVESARAGLRSQERIFVFNQDAIMGDWKSTLRNEKSISFDIGAYMESPMFSRFARVRVSRARCYLKGATRTGGSTIDLMISTASHFKDRGIMPPYDVFEFFGETAARYFEYEVVGERILADGVYVDAHEYSRPALFTTWTVDVVDPVEVDGVVNLDGVTDVLLEVTCEVSRRR